MYCTYEYNIRPNDIGMMTPKELRPYELLSRTRIRENDQQHWILGQYIKCAVIDGISMTFGGGKNETVYPREPYSTKVNLTEEEQAEIEEREMQEELRKMELWISNDKKRGLAIQTIA